MANGLHEPNESYSLIEWEILTIDLDVRHLKNKEKERDVKRDFVRSMQRYAVVYCVFDVYINHCHKICFSQNFHDYILQVLVLYRITIMLRIMLLVLF